MLGFLLDKVEFKRVDDLVEYHFLDRVRAGLELCEFYIELVGEHVYLA